MGCQKSVPVKQQSVTTATQTSFSSSSSTTRRIYETPPSSACTEERAARKQEQCEEEAPRHITASSSRSSSSSSNNSNSSGARRWRRVFALSSARDASVPPQQPLPASDPMRPSAAAAASDDPTSSSSSSPMSPHSAPRTPVTPMTAEEEERLQQQREERVESLPHQPVSTPELAAAAEHQRITPVDVPRLQLPGGAVTPPALEDALEDSWVGGSSMSTDSLPLIGTNSISREEMASVGGALSSDSLGLSSSKHAAFGVVVTASRSSDSDDADECPNVSFFGASRSSSSSMSLGRSPGFTPQTSPTNSAVPHVPTIDLSRTKGGNNVSSNNINNGDLHSFVGGSSVESGDSNPGRSAASSVCSWDEALSEQQQEWPPRGVENSSGDCARRRTFSPDGTA